MSDDGKWKNALLSSGVPLEATVARELKNHGCFVFGEHEFTAPGVDGETKLRSVDIAAYWDLPTAKLEILAECKYRRDHVKWFFLPDSLFLGQSQDWATNCLVSPFVPPWYAPRALVPPVLRFGYQPARSDHESYRVVSKGVEIIPGNAGSSKDDASTDIVIKTALHQVRYAVASSMFRFPAVRSQDFDAHLYSRVRFILPMIVTTADLLVINDDVGVNEVRQANAPEDLATRVGVLIVRNDPSRSLRSHMLGLLRRNYDRLVDDPTTQQEAFVDEFDTFRRMGSSSSFAEAQTYCGPNNVILIHLDSLPGFLSSLESLLSHPSNLQRSGAEASAIGGIAFDIEEHFRRCGRASKTQSARS